MSQIVRSQIKNLPELQSHIHGLGVTINLSLSTTLRDIDLDHHMFQNPFTCKLFFLQAVIERDPELATTLIKRFNLSLVDNYIIYRSLYISNPHVIQSLVDLGFKFETDLINPFCLCVWLYNWDTAAHFSLQNSINMFSSDQIHDIERIFDILIAAGYDIHLDNDMAFCHCYHPDLLSYFIKHDCNIQLHQTNWIKIYIENFGGNSRHFPLEPIKLLIAHGMELNKDVALHAIHMADPELISLLIENQFDMESLLQMEIGNLGLKFTRDKHYSEEQLAQLLKYLIEYRCDLSLLNPNLVKFLAMHYRHNALKVLIDNGINLTKIIKETNSTGHLGNKQQDLYKTIKLLTEQGLSLEEIFQFIFGKKIW